MANHLGGASPKLYIVQCVANQSWLATRLQEVSDTGMTDFLQIPHASWLLVYWTMYSDHKHNVDVRTLIWWVHA